MIVDVWVVNVLLGESLTEVDLLDVDDRSKSDLTRNLLGNGLR